MIYFCIPTYNEERTVGVLLWKIRQVMAEFPRDFQILVVNDASTDATAEVLAPYERVLPLTVFHNEERRGYAASLEMMLTEAVRRSDYPRRDVVITLQADFTEEPDEIPSLVKRIEGGADVVTTSAVLKTTDAPRSVRWTRKLLSFLIRRGHWPEGITDPLSGFRAYRIITLKKALESRPGRPLVQGQGWVANVELLRAVLPFARRVDEAPVPLRYDRRYRRTRFQAWATARQIFPLLRYQSEPLVEAGPSTNGKSEAAAEAPPRRPRRRRPAGEDGRRRSSSGRSRQGPRRRTQGEQGTEQRRREQTEPGAEQRRREQAEPGTEQRPMAPTGEPVEHQQEREGEIVATERKRPRRGGARRGGRRRGPRTSTPPGGKANEGRPTDGPDDDA